MLLSNLIPYFSSARQKHENFSDSSNSAIQVPGYSWSRVYGSTRDLGTRLAPRVPLHRGQTSAHAREISFWTWSLQSLLNILVFLWRWLVHCIFLKKNIFVYIICFVRFRTNYYYYVQKKTVNWVWIKIAENMILFSVLYLIFWCHYFSLPRQVSNFCCLDKATIPPVYLQLSTTLYRPSWAAVHNTFFLSAFSLPLCIFIRWSCSVTTTVKKSQWGQAFACRLF